MLVRIGIKVKILVQVDDRPIKEVDIPDGLSNKQEYEFLYAGLYNDTDVRSNIGTQLKKVVYVPGKFVNLLTKELII